VTNAQSYNINENYNVQCKHVYKDNNGIKMLQW